MPKRKQHQNQGACTENGRKSKSRPRPTLCAFCEEALAIDDSDLRSYLRDDIEHGTVIRCQSEDEPLGHFVREDTLPDLPSLKRSTDNGCSFCGFLRNQILSQEFALKCPVELHFTYWWDLPINAMAQPSGLCSLVVEVQSLGEERTIHKIFFKVEAEQQTFAPWLGMKIAPESQPLCRKNVEAIRSWLETTSSTCCRDSSSGGTATPTRLLDLGTSYRRSPRLILTSPVTASSTATARFEYAALSYCWGPTNKAALNLKTEKSTLKSHMQGIQIQKLPQALQDAVKVCRKLSIRFLWVDSLCIMQDDEDDWQKEASKMGEIYHNATFTICALASQSCDESYLDRRSFSVRLPFKSTIQPRVKGNYRLMHTLLNPRGYGIFTKLYLDLGTASWNKRAWTYQECFLSRRLIYFGSDSLHFSCPHNMHSENDPALYEPYNLSLPQIEIEASAERNLSKLYSYWYEMAPDYNQRDLTNPEDKFPALAGLASRYSDLLDDKYVAGLWQKDLIVGLMWNTSGKMAWKNLIERLESKNPANAPSWSWARQTIYFEMGTASFSLGVGSPRHSVIPCATLHVEVEHTGNDSFGRIDKALINIVGMVKKAPKIMHKTTTCIDTKCWEMRFNNDTTVLFCQTDWLDEGHTAMLPTGLLLLKLGSYYNDAKLKNVEIRVDTVVFGLLIYPTGVRDGYRRVGVFSSHRFVDSLGDAFEGLQPRKICLI